MSRPDGYPTVLIQLASVDDVPTIAALLHEAFVEYEPLYSAGAFAATTPTQEQIRARWTEGPVWIAHLAGRASGTVAAVPKSQAVYVRSMAVRPKARGYGVGRLLLKQVEEFARERGCDRLFLSTTPFLHGALRLYEQFGFIRTNAGPHELQGTPLFTLEKVLTAGAVSLK